MGESVGLHRRHRDRNFAAMSSERQKNLILTGASRGIGHATVKRFNAAGWRVVTVSRQEFSPDCPWIGGEGNHVQLDLADLDGLPAVIEDLRERLDGHLDALVNNAAISPKGEDGARLGVLETDMATWQQVFNVNLFSIVMLAQGLIDPLQAAGGSIVNVTSIAGMRVHPFAGAAYGTAKAALAALTREMAHELGPRGVRVNAIAPGEIDTSILSPGTEEIVEREIPLRRLGSPEEVAATIFFLCSAQASYVNGAEIHINGGQHV
jgi:NAD(P)-dependent dehydrogenase (short-subunit alcohol dehydrogenase family)